MSDKDNLLIEEENQVIFSYESNSVISPKLGDRLIIEDEDSSDNTKIPLSNVNEPANNKSKIFLYIAILVVALVGGFGTYILTSQKETLASWFSYKEKIDKEIKTSEITSKAKNKDEKIEKEITDVSSSEYVEKDIDKKILEKEIETKTASSKNSGNSSGTLQTPCWVIVFASVAIENNAKNAIKRLAKEGLRAGYFWTPDLIPTGAELFKVYVGPYNSKEEAKKNILLVKDMENEAFVMHIK